MLQFNIFFLLLLFKCVLAIVHCIQVGSQVYFFLLLHQYKFHLLFLEEDLDDAMFGLPTRHRPEELGSLERSTKFTRKEIQLIYRGFKQVFNYLFVQLKSYTNNIKCATVYPRKTT